jgi:hypothetical protein
MDGTGAAIGTTGGAGTNVGGGFAGRDWLGNGDSSGELDDDDEDGLDSDDGSGGR